MNRRTYLLLFMALLNLTITSSKALRVQKPTRSLTGTFCIHPNFHSKYLQANRDVIVYLPPGYDTNPKARYPVLYMQDGQNLFDGATSYIPGKEWRMDETAERLIRENAIKPVIIVGIYNAGIERLNEYTPTQDGKGRGGKADDYGKMLVEELKPFIDTHYRTKKGPQDTGLGGSSLGGLVSLYLGLKYPNVFGKLLVVSPSVWWDNRFIVRQIQALKARPPLQVWMDMGTKEGDPKFQEANLAEAHLLRDALLTGGWKTDHDFHYMEAEGAEHNEEAWAARVEPMLRFLFPRK